MRPSFAAVAVLFSTIVACSDPITATPVVMAPDGGAPSQVGSSTPDSGLPGPSVSGDIAAVCSTEAKAYCTALAQRAPDVFAWKFGAAPACESITRDGCALVMSSPHTGWTVAGRQACATAWATATLDELVTTNLPAACRVPPGGKKADNATCAWDSECASRTCIVPPGARCGVCAPRIKSGGTCNDGLDCEDGLDCIAGADGSFACAPIKPTLAIGTACAAQDACGAARYCRGTWTWSDATQAWSIQGGTCQGYTAVGVNSACGEFDGPSTQTSAPILDVKLCLQSYCKYANESDAVGTCVAVPTTGQPCDLSIGCIGLNTCVGGTCIAYAALACN